MIRITGTSKFLELETWRKIIQKSLRRISRRKEHSPIQQKLKLTPPNSRNTQTNGLSSSQAKLARNLLTESQTYTFGDNKYTDPFGIFNKPKASEKNSRVQKWLDLQNEATNQYFTNYPERPDIDALWTKIQSHISREPIFMLPDAKQIFSLLKEVGGDGTSVTKLTVLKDGEEKVFFDPSGDTKEQIAQLPENLTLNNGGFPKHQQPTFSQDGSRVLIGFSEEKKGFYGDFYVFDTHTGEHVGDFQLRTWKASISSCGKYIYAKPRLNENEGGHYGSSFRINIQTGERTTIHDALDDDQLYPRATEHLL